MNDIPAGEAVKPLLSDHWYDMQSHSSYPTDRPGTFDTGLAKNKNNYIIMHQALNKLLVEVGIEIRGSYQPKLWNAFERVNATIEASDHHCIWADFDI